MIYATAQLIVSIVLLALTAAEVTAWAIMGRISGIGYVICAAVLWAFWALVRVSYEEYKEKKEK